MIAKEHKKIDSLFEKKGGGMERAIACLSGINALVVGIASTGISCSRFLRKSGAIVTATDSRPEHELKGLDPLKRIGVNIVAGGHEGVSLDGVQLAIVSPGVPQDAGILNALRKRGAEAISDIELAYLFMDSPVVAVAGTNGKSTTVSLIGEVLKEAGRKVFVGGNIGTPAIELVQSGERPDVCVLEISSFHLEATKTFNPNIAVLLNITEDHLDRYRDFAHYAETKFRLFENQTREDHAIVNMNDPVISGRVRLKGCGKGGLIPFSVKGGLDNGLFLRDGDIVYIRGGSREVYATQEIGLTGLHNMENIMASIAVARTLGIDREDILRTLKGFKALSHRMELVREVSGVRYIDDSKGTNTGATLMALKGLKGPVVLIAGGRDKGGDLSVLDHEIGEKVTLLILIGEARFRMRDAYSGITETVFAGSMKEAVRLAHKGAKEGSTVLLSPACSSFDMFSSYKERGERFRQEVEAL
jgi:UDP-N-acetylmuramoylalanine--D-glutamate ligase